jgi:hypothetical protein
MSRTLHCKVCVMLFPVATGIGIAQAHQILYDQDGYKLAVGVEAGLGGFAVGNVDTGAGNVKPDAPLQRPFPPSERRTTRDWFEGFAKPFVELETPFFLSATPMRSSASSARSLAGMATRLRA